MGPIGKVILGLVIGCAFTYLYTKFNYKQPAPLKLLSAYKSIPAFFIADNILEDPNSNLSQQQMAIAIYIRHDPDFFVSVDNMIDNNFTKRVLDNQLKKKKTKQVSRLNSYRTGLDMVTNNDSLRKSLEKRYGSNWQQYWERKLLAESIKDDPYIFDHFKKKFQTTSVEKIAEKIISINSKKQH
jgi:hypothetical protein